MMPRRTLPVLLATAGVSVGLVGCGRQARALERQFVDAARSVSGVTEAEVSVSWSNPTQQAPSAAGRILIDTADRAALLRVFSEAISAICQAARTEDERACTLDAVRGYPPDGGEEDRITIYDLPGITRPDAAGPGGTSITQLLDAGL